MPLENQSRKILQMMEASHLGHPGAGGGEQKRSHLERKVKEGFGHLCSRSRTGLASCNLFFLKKKIFLNPAHIFKMSRVRPCPPPPSSITERFFLAELSHATVPPNCPLELLLKSKVQGQVFQDLTRTGISRLSLITQGL